MFYDTYVELCKRKGIAPSAAADAIGINRATVTNWKKKDSTPSGTTLQKVADYFGVTVDYLLAGNDTHYLDNSWKGEQPAEPSLERDSSPDTIKNAPVGGESDAELADYLDELRTRPEQRAMFSLTKDATKEDVEAAVAIVDAYMKSRGLMKDE